MHHGGSTSMKAPLPTGALCHGVRLVGHAAQGSGVQVMVHRGHAYVGHADGVTILDVRNPEAPVVAGALRAAAGTWNIHLQTHGDLLLVVDEVNFHKHRQVFADAKQYYGQSIGLGSRLFGVRGRDYSAGLRVFDLADPAAPRQIGYMAVEGLGVHRVWYDGGPYAYASALIDGYTDHIFLVIDLSDPSAPREAGRWWLPGMWHDGGERPDWTRRYALHHPIVADGVAYCAWRDGGMTLLDVRDPSAPQLISHHNWSPPFGGNTHVCLPLARRNLVVALDEAVLDDGADVDKHAWVIDVRDKSNPVNVATFHTPSEQNYRGVGGHFGPHNLHENRSGSWQDDRIVFATFQNAGVRVVDLADPFRPDEIAFFVPPRPSPGSGAGGAPKLFHSYGSSDVFVDAHGLMYICDFSTGLYIVDSGLRPSTIAPSMP